MPKGSQNGAEIDAQTHQQSMPKLVTEKIMEIINNHVSLNGKFIEIHCKNKCFWWFRRLYVRTVKVSKKTAKVRQTPFQNRWTIDTKIMLEKGIPQNIEIRQTSDRKGSWKVIKKQCETNRKQMDFLVTPGVPLWC